LNSRQSRQKTPRQQFWATECNTMLKDKKNGETPVEGKVEEHADMKYI
jgi:hypothetical protein